jgi:hypothetical protein
VELPSLQLLLGSLLIFSDVDEAECQLATVPAKVFDARHRPARLMRVLVPGLEGFRQSSKMTP